LTEIVLDYFTKSAVQSAFIAEGIITFVTPFLFAGQAIKIRFRFDTELAAIPVIDPAAYAPFFFVPARIMSEVKGASEEDVFKIPQKYPYL